MSSRVMFLSITFLGVALLSVSCGINPCADVKEESIASPDGKFTATLFVRNCGATTPYITHVSVVRNTWLPRDAFNMDNNIVFSIKNKPAVELRWESGDSLLIRYTRVEGVQPSKLAKQWGQVAITATPTMVDKARR